MIDIGATKTRVRYHDTLLQSLEDAVVIFFLQPHKHEGKIGSLMALIWKIQVYCPQSLGWSKNLSLRENLHRFRCARPDTLDPALLRSGRLDRKIELPHPNEETRGGVRVRGVTWGARNGWVGGVSWVGWWVG